ncbi:MAG TPA: VOC family protein [Candidatus Methylacidiphilales bacterium]|nr:VOC family protein [Candidatus Methylacidiphilales bacterium]
MIKVNEVAYIAYPSTDMARSRAFYEGVLGLKPTYENKRENFAWVEYDIGATTLGIGQSADWKPSREGPTVALEADDFDEAIAGLRQHGLSFVMEPFETPVCNMALIRDPDGNQIMIHKRKPGRG